MDVFALGLVAYFIFTHGRHPFHYPSSPPPSRSSNPPPPHLNSLDCNNNSAPPSLNPAADGNDSTPSLNPVGTDDKPTHENTGKKLEESFHDAYSSLASLQAMQRAIIEKREPLLSNVVVSIKSSPSSTVVEEGREQNLDGLYSKFILLFPQQNVINSFQFYFQSRDRKKACKIMNVSNIWLVES